MDGIGAYRAAHKITFTQDLKVSIKVAQFGFALGRNRVAMKIHGIYISDRQKN